MSQAELKTALTKTIASIESNPAGANLVFKAETRLEEGVRCSANVRGFSMGVDEPPELGGADTAMNPVELILVALGTCQEIMYGAYAAVMDIELESVEVQVKGYLDVRGLFAMAEVAAGYKNIRFETNIKSPASPEQIRKLVEQVESHCPVMDTITRSIQVSGESYHNGTAVGATKLAAAAS
jgi:putative redox protein